MNKFPRPRLDASQCTKYYTKKAPITPRSLTTRHPTI